MACEYLQVGHDHYRVIINVIHHNYFVTKNLSFRFMVLYLTWLINLRSTFLNKELRYRVNLWFTVLRNSFGITEVLQLAPRSAFI